VHLAGDLGAGEKDMTAAFVGFIWLDVGGCLGCAWEFVGFRGFRFGFGLC
jgi:hypothetical protein